MKGVSDPPRVFHDLPDDASSAAVFVDLTWDEGRIEHRIRFGRPVCDRVRDRHRRSVGFAPGSIFAFLRWAANDFGTVLSRIDILRAVGAGEAFQTVPFVRPGGEVLLKLAGWPRVERVLQLIDAIEALGIDPAEVAPDYWRHVHNRLTIGAEPRRYSRDQHRAWIARRGILP